MIKDYYNVSSIKKVPGIVFAEGNVNVQKIASLAKRVIQVSVNEDSVAHEIVKEAGNDIGNLTVSLLKNLNVPVEHLFPIYQIGGIWKTDSVFISESRKVVKAVFPNASWEKPISGPAKGAALMAQYKYEESLNN